MRADHYGMESDGYEKNKTRIKRFIGVCEIDRQEREREGEVYTKIYTPSSSALHHHSSFLMSAPTAEGQEKYQIQPEPQTMNI